MTLLQFIRILLKHKYLLLAVPFIVALLVFLATANSPKKYVSKTVIYTGIASGHTIENQSNSRVDFFATNNAFDNLLNIIQSRQTIEKVGLLLFSKHILLAQANQAIISNKSFAEIQTITPSYIKNMVDTTSLENTYLRLSKLKNSNDTNFIYKLIKLDHKHYSFNAISKVNVKRIANSDLLELHYECDDPGICQQTLMLLNKVFIENYTDLKINQTDAVVKYFEEQLRKAEEKLGGAEDKMLLFNEKNKIINYYEQTKHIASQKEKFELKYQEVQLEYSAALSAIKTLEEKTYTQLKIKLQNNRILELREKLSAISGTISTEEMKLLSSANYDNTSKMDSLQKESQQLKLKLQETIDSLFAIENTREGLNAKEIAKDWLKQIITFEEAKAKLTTLDLKRLEFEELYKQYAPLGATLKRIEREINVQEQEYLSLLHSLALAKLKQQNLELSSNLKIVDEPFYPISSLPSKRKLLIIVGFMASFVFTITLVVASEYFDRNLKNTVRAETQTGLKSFGALPIYSEDNEANTIAHELAVEKLSKQIIYNKMNSSSSSPYCIAFTSARVEEGKSYVTSLLYNKLRNKGVKAALITNRAEKETDSIFVFNDMDSLFMMNEVHELVANPNQFDVILFDLPCMRETVMPFHILKKFHEHILVARANRSWADADTSAVNQYKASIANSQLSVLINGENLYDLEMFVGELPKKRFWLRTKLKQLVQMQFYSKKKIV